MCECDGGGERRSDGGHAHKRTYTLTVKDDGDRGKTAARGINREVGPTGVAGGETFGRGCVASRLRPSAAESHRARRPFSARAEESQSPASCAVGYLASAPVRSTAEVVAVVVIVAAAGLADTRVHTRRHRRRRRRTLSADESSPSKGPYARCTVSLCFSSNRGILRPRNHHHRHQPVAASGRSRHHAPAAVDSREYTQV